MAFSILEHLDTLKPADKKGRYTCPVCGGNDLTINNESGAYQCWSGCECRDIRNAIAPLPERSDTPNYKSARHQQKSSQKPKPVVPPEGEINLAKLPAPATDTPKPRKDYDKIHGEIFKTTYCYSLTPEGDLNRWVVRTDWADPSKPKGRSKKFRQWHLNEDGKAVCKKGENPWELYRIDEFVEAVKATSGIPIGLAHEGEKPVERGRAAGIASTSPQGSCWNPKDLERSLTSFKEKCPNGGLAFLRDNDAASIEKAKLFEEVCDQVGIFSVVIDPLDIYPDLGEKGDIAEILEAMDTEEFIKKLEQTIHKNVEARRASILESARKLEEQFQSPQRSKSSQAKKPDLPSAAEIAITLRGIYRDQLAFHTGIQTWYKYSAKIEGVWAPLSKEAVELLVIAHLESRTSRAGNYSYSFVSGCVNLLKAHLLVDEWQEIPGLLPMLDGVLDLATRELLPHAQSYRLLWCLPYAWKDRGIGCQPVQEWLLETVKGDKIQVELLRAYLNCVVTGRTDLHRFLELIGPGGTGKSTYMRLAAALVGDENTAVTTLEQLEKNRFETAGIFGKRLLMITDSDKFGGEVNTLKAITGQDDIRYERKNVQQTKPFKATCMVIVGANEPVQSSDYTSGLERRRLTLPFIHQVKAEDRRDLNTEFKSYLPGVLEWVLSMPSARIVELVRNTESAVKSLSKQKAENLLSTNALAEWLDFCVALEPNAKTYVGVAKKDKSSDSQHSYLFIDQWLYASYCEFSSNTGSKSVSLRRFSTLLHDLCTSQLKLDGIGKGRDNKGTYFQGLEIRFLHDDRPRIITEDNDSPDEPPSNGGGGSGPPQPKPEPSDGFGIKSDGKMTESDGKVTAETLASDGSDGSDGLFQSCSIAESELKSESQRVITDATENVVAAECEILPSLPSLKTEIQHQQGFQPSLTPKTIHHNPSQSITTAIQPPLTSAPTKFQVGDVVALADEYTVAYTFHGAVEEVVGDGNILVRWAERQGKPFETETYRVCELRRLE